MPLSASSVVELGEADKPLGRRDRAKEERRSRIVDAARELIREGQGVTLSIRDVAARAGVSTATCYNLFGSKRAVVLAASRDILGFYERFEGVRHKINPLERMFVALEILAEIYNEDPDFHRPIWLAVISSSGDVRPSFFTPKRHDFWFLLCEEAVEAGVVSRDVNVDLFVRHLDFDFRSILGDWALGFIPGSVLSSTLCYSLAIALSGVVEPDWRGPARLRLKESQQDLIDHEIDIRSKSG